MTVEAAETAIEPAQQRERPSAAFLARRAWRRAMRRLAHLGFYYRFTTIAGRIVALNIISLLVMIAGMLYLSDFRDRLIAARGESLKIEAEIISKALTLDGAPAISDKLDDVILGESFDGIYRISQEKAADLIYALVKPDRSQPYIFGPDGALIIDSRRIYRGGVLTRIQNSSRRADQVSRIYRIWLSFERMLRADKLPRLGDIGALSGKAIPEVKAALEERTSSPIVRENELGETVLNFAVPIEKGGAVVGALLLTTGEAEIDTLIAEERLSALRVGVLILGVTIMVSFVLAGTIAGPMHRLAQAVERVRNNVRGRTDIPDYSHRSDEIGNLARALREMTNALYARMEATERFAADVAHELKNPLTSMQSAIDTIPLAKREEDRERLMQIVRHDVRRLDRLITDISDASRLDAELHRELRHPVNIAELLEAICTAQNEIQRERSVKIVLQIKGATRVAALGSKSPFMIYGDGSRLSQVVINLIDNAVSFSPENGKIRIACCLVRKTREAEIVVEDDGPGIPPENLEKIFERFYTDRPAREEFGNNSGLGLNISRQIVTAHKGSIWAENRYAPPLVTKVGETKPGRILGARLRIRVPLINQ